MGTLKTYIEGIRDYIDNPRNGLPEELFLFATEITPMVNVDLLVRDDEGRILLAWRDDDIYGTGWHVPGGIIRLKESFSERIQKTAELELGCNVIAGEIPLEIVPIICPEMQVRGHFISFVYECKLPDDYCINNGNRSRHERGYLEWHRRFPDDMLEVHGFYKKYFIEN